MLIAGSMDANHMRRTSLPLSLAALLGLTQGATANPAPDLGPTRQLCIGDQAECTRNIATKLTAGKNLDLVVTFEYDSAILTKDAKANLDIFAVALKDQRLSTAAFLVEGHTDAKGRASYNLELSTRRARAVVDYLKQGGIDTTKFVAKGYGSQRPIAEDPLAAANRRVETRVRTE